MVKPHDRKFTLHIWWQYFFVPNSCLVASSLESDKSLIHFSLYFLFFLVLQKHNLLIIIVVLLFQAGRSDKKASQGHEEKHRGWFRYVTTGCAIDLYLFTNILDAVWQVFQGVKNICFLVCAAVITKLDESVLAFVLFFWGFLFAIFCFIYIYIAFCLFCFHSTIYYIFVCFLEYLENVSRHGLC